MRVIFRASSTSLSKCYHQQLREAQHGIERRSQVMAQAGKELHSSAGDLLGAQLDAQDFVTDVALHAEDARLPARSSVLDDAGDLDLAQAAIREPDARAQLH